MFVQIVYICDILPSPVHVHVCVLFPLYAVFRFIIIHTLPHFSLINLSIVRPHSIAFEPEQVTVHWHRE